MTTAANALSKNRAEELGYDVWSSFVVPPFFAELGIFETKKPKLIIGGRGCGKTMLLRYLSHQSAFSPNRSVVPPNELRHVGLYWRADTQFANAMQKRNIAGDVWSSAFSHFACLLIAGEVLRSLQSIAYSNYSGFGPSDLEQLRFPRLQAFDSTLPDQFSALEKAFEFKLHSLEAWVSDVKAPEPRFYPAVSFIGSMLKDLKNECSALSEAVFFVYIDEYENLVEYQQELVNTWVKSSEAPLIFNLAMKRNGFQTRKTVGSESLSDIHDFRQHDIEAYLKEDFSAFAAEILVLRLSQGEGKASLKEIARLNDPAALSGRSEASYRAGVLREVERLLPDMSEEQIASTVFAEKGIANKLRERIENALKVRGSAVSVNTFFRPEAPKASIITPALLYRKNLEPALVAEELEKYILNLESKFDDWIHNNFIGCLLQLYEPYSRACPFYAGFYTFCHLSHGNVRYFLELCYRCLARKDDLTLTPVEVQAEVARQASGAFLHEVRSFGTKGNQLYSFVLGLGSLFALAHLRDTQSESEQTHFSIKEGHRGLSMEDQTFLAEAVKWSVLFESPATKQKTDYEPEGNDYTLNPVYAPYFHISYRKRRKLEITSDDLHTLIHGEYSQISELLKRQRNLWAILTSSLPLFSHLEETEA